MEILIYHPALRMPAVVLEEAPKIEELGFDGLVMPDHLYVLDFQSGVPLPYPHPLPVLSAAAAVTKRVKLLALVSNNLARGPVELAQQTATLANLAPGRVELAIGAGWFEAEHVAAGVGFPRGADRVRRLVESVSICRRLFADAAVDHDGEHYQVRVPVGGFAPVQEPIPIMVGAAAPAMIRAAARVADRVDLQPDASSGGGADLRHIGYTFACRGGRRRACHRGGRRGRPNDPGERIALRAHHGRRGRGRGGARQDMADFLGLDASVLEASFGTLIGSPDEVGASFSATSRPAATECISRPSTPRRRRASRRRSRGSGLVDDGHRGVADRRGAALAATGGGAVLRPGQRGSGGGDPRLRVVDQPGAPLDLAAGARGGDRRSPRGRPRPARRRLATTGAVRRRDRPRLLRDWEPTCAFSVASGWASGVYAVRDTTTAPVRGATRDVRRAPASAPGGDRRAARHHLVGVQPVGRALAVRRRRLQRLAPGRHRLARSAHAPDRLTDLGGEPGPPLLHLGVSPRALARARGLRAGGTSPASRRTGARPSTSGLLISAGHDEYWSGAMRDALDRSLAAGTSLLWAGANGLCWNVRLQPSELGDDRTMICYKDHLSDPLIETAPGQVTGRWGEWPLLSPSRTRSASAGSTGTSRESHPASWIVRAGDHPIFEGTGLRTGDRVPGIVGDEWDAFDPSSPAAGTAVVLGETEGLAGANLGPSRGTRCCTARPPVGWSWPAARPAGAGARRQHGRGQEDGARPPAAAPDQSVHHRRAEGADCDAPARAASAQADVAGQKLDGRGHRGRGRTRPNHPRSIPCRCTAADW